MKSKIFLLLLLSLYIVNCTLYITHATTHYVSKTGSSTPPYTSWETAADSIQKCINISQFGDTIYVSNGVYKEQIIMIDGLSLIGAGTDSCIIDTRELAQPSSFYALEFYDSCLVKGFTINVSFGNIGIGIEIDRPGSTAVNGIVDSNKILNASYGLWLDNSDATIQNNIIINVEDGIRIGGFSPNYYPIIENNFISATRNGIIISVGATPIIRSNIFYVNDEFAAAYTGGGTDTAKVYNNIAIVEEGFEYTYWFPPAPTIGINNLVFGNFNQGIRSTNVGPGINVIKNNLLLGGNDGIYNSNSSIVQYNNSWDNQINYQGFTPDSTNLSVDPMVVSEDSNDFHLQMYSPLIDAGDPDILDIDGSRSDIGVFGGPYGEKYTYRDLAPKPPSNLTATLDSGLILLTWNKNTAADFFRYRVYRDTVPNFMYDTTKIIAVVADTFYYDKLPEKYIEKNYYYKLTAIDSAYHQSAASEEAQVTITGIAEAPPVVIERYQLLNNYPNPFNSTTIIPYRLLAPGYVKLYVYNLLGEVVSVLVNQWQERGYYEIEFRPTKEERYNGRMGSGLEFPTGYNDDIATGIYLYQIFVRGEGNIPAFQGMGKMILLK